MLPKEIFNLSDGKEVINELETERSQKMNEQTKHWCSVVDSDASHDEMFSTMAEVLREMGIACEQDDEIAKERGVDLFIVFTKIEENDNE